MKSMKKSLIVLVILLAGVLLLQLPANLQPETGFRQRVLRQSFAPSFSNFNLADGTSVEGAAYFYDPVYPLVVDFAEVDPNAEHIDSMYERWLRGEIDLDENESILSAAEVAELQLIAMRSGVTPDVQIAESGPDRNAPIPAGINFDSIDYNSSGGFVPPDPEMVVGPYHIIVVVNVSVAIYDKSGNILLGPVPATSLFSHPSCTSGLYDPNLLYDEELDRWIIAYDKGAFSSTGGYCLLASQSGDPLGLWNEYFFQLNSGAGWLDYPHAGVGDNFIFMGGNIFSLGGSYIEGRIYAFDKMSLYTGNPVSVIAQGLTSTYDTPQPIKLHGANTGSWPNWGNTHFFLAEPYDGINYTLFEWDTSTLTNRGNLAIGTGLFPVQVTQSGGSNIQANDWRPLDFEYHNGFGWMTATNGCNPGGGTVNCLLWAQIDLDTASIGPSGSGIYTSVGEHRFFPDLAVNACGDMALGYSKSSPSMFPAVFVTGRESNDPPGLLQAEVQLKAGEIAYTAFDSPPRRWGDYSGMTIDPDGVTFWYIGEYSKNTGNTNGRWGNYVGSFTYPDCNITTVPNITLNKTVGTDSSVCAATNEITVTVGTDVTYCYEVSNDGDVSLNLHTLVDSQFGEILNNFPYELSSGASVFLTQTTTVMETVTNIAIWTAFNTNMSYVYDDTSPYNFIDISLTGTPLNLTDDGEANVTMPFEFTYFGVTSNLVRIGNNGGILFATTTGDVAVTNAALPNASHPLAIFPFWDDLDDETGNVYYETVGASPNRMFIVQWHERPHFPGPGVGNVTFQAILYEATNHILFQYTDLDFGDPAYNYGASATVGLNKDAVHAVQYSINSSVLADGMAIRWIPTNMVSSTNAATVNVLIPEISVSPTEIVVEQVESLVVNYPLLITNSGEGVLNWTIHEASPLAFQTQVQSRSIISNNLPPMVEIVTDASQCDQYMKYAGAEPLGYAEYCMSTVPISLNHNASPLAPFDTGYALDIGFVSDNFVTFVLNDFPGQSVIGENTMALFGMDFDPTATILYALDNAGQQLGTLDLTSGEFTPIGTSLPQPGHTWSGLTIDPVSGTFYASSTDGSNASLYTIDPYTGATTLIGSQTTTPLLIDIAINMSGVMYGHDIATDAIYTIDPATGAATLVGSTGYNANFAQGMDFDNDDGTLYIFLYLGGGANVYGTVDLITGAVTPLAVDNPIGEFEGAIQVPGFVPTCSLITDIPWLSLDQTSGSTPASSSIEVVVSIDTNSLSLGNTYNVTLCINSNDPVNPLVEVPIEVTVIPAVFGVGLSTDQESSGDVGSTVTYTLEITNTGNTSDTFNLTAIGSWTSSISNATIQLGVGESTTFSVSVMVPTNALNGSTDVTTITATSQSDPNALDTSLLTTIAIVPTKYIYLPVTVKQ
jgi:hypothetical protein